MESQVRQIGQSRFPSTYWPALDKAISTCLESHTYVIVNEGNHSAICQWQIAEPGIPTIAAFLLVCPPFSEDVVEYGLHTTPIAHLFEIAFVAVSCQHEGKGLARQLMSHVLQIGRVPCWLHVDTVNIRAKRLYESLGMIEYRIQPDPYGYEGSIMISNNLESWGNSYMEIGSTLFDSRPCEFKQTFCRSIFTPPLMTSY
jgi:hypothetical protein